jgi:transposase
MPPGQACFSQGHAARLRLSDRKQQGFLLTTVLVAVGKEAMSYRELIMIDVKELLRRWSAGHSNRKIARETGADRATVRRYVQVARELGLEYGHEFSDDEVHEIAQRIQARPVRDASAEWNTIAKHKARIEEWLGRQRPLTLTKILTLLMREHNVEASYDTLRRYVIQELGWRQKEPTILLEDPPAGQEAQVDFGKMGMMVDSQTGRKRLLWALVVTLCFSRYQFVWPTFAQTTEAVCEGLERAWKFFGAMIRVLVPDNTKAMIKYPDALAPTLVAAFLDYVQARGIFVDPARVRSPKDKARVENQMPYVRESWFDGETFTDLDDARASAELWCRDVAGARVHGTTRQVPRELFESVEKPAMLPPPTEPFDVPLWFDDVTVHPDHHIQVARALYSVPTLYLRKKVRVRADKTLVRIYFGTECIKVHPRQLQGGRSTDVNDYPVGKSAYALRRVDALVAKAKVMGPHVGSFAERLLGGPLPWTRMRQAYALLRLCDKYGQGRVEAICQTALAFDVVDVTRVKRMLKSAAKPTTSSANTDSGSGKVVQLPLRFARPDEHFKTRPTCNDSANKAGQ